MAQPAQPTFNYVPRPHALAYHERTQRYACLIWHRRAGKTYMLLNDMIVRALIPLRGKTVSGLHCEFNLQIISTYENRAKQNRSPDHHDHPTPDTNSRGVCV